MNEELLSPEEVDNAVFAESDRDTTPEVSQPWGGVPNVVEVSRKQSMPQRQHPRPANSLNVTLLERLKRVEDKVRRLEQLETVRSSAVSPQVSSRQFQAMVNYVQKLSEEARDIATGLQGTPGYDLYRTFQCENCGGREQVATIFMCTACKQASWRGWWPKR